MPHAVIVELIIAGDVVIAALRDPAKRDSALEAWHSAVRSATRFRADPANILMVDNQARLHQGTVALESAGAILVDVLNMRTARLEIVASIVQQWHDAVKKVLESDQMLRGKLLYEIAELDAFSKAEENVQGIDVTALQPSAKVTLAPTLLIDAADAIENRASQRDKPDGERSMRCAVNTFNALTGQQLSEREGWIFMVLLKLARAQGGKHTRDDYVDGAGYLALACESVELDK